jgi:hypothetical protein
MIIKAVEIRDRHTFIPAIAIRMIAANDAQGYLMRHVGFHGDGVVLMRLNDQEAHSDPYDWRSGSRTMPQAHLWLLEHFDEIEDGSVIDVEYILGESSAPKTSEARGWE